MADKIYYYGDGTQEASDDSYEIRKLVGEMLEQPASKPGNTAKLRSALEKAYKCVQYRMSSTVLMDGSADIYHYKNEIMDALSSPPRNCDRFEKENDAWDEFMRTQYPQYAGRELPEKHARQIIRRYCSWLFEESRKGEK